ncbi:sigma-54 interaction domain-containing protein [Fibrobacter sp.]|uniref:sigma-54 interaction domain-containing protein n=1 Tax=Fibrobacter sp. TaxID=35828 RepID=UPI00388D6F10
MSSIQLFSNETDTSAFIQDVLSSVNYELETFTAWTKAEQVSSPIVVWDLDSFAQCNVEALTAIRLEKPDTMILVYAEDPEKFISIPNNLYDIILSVESLKLHLMSKILRLKDIYSAKMIFRERMSHLVGKSPAMESLRKTVERTILHTGPVLIQGESGVGKDLVARAIACMYERFVTVNCSAIPDALFESELFGHTRGAFTGAQNERIGLFEEANGGAIFLDEIGDMPLHAQVKLLRVIQNREIRPIGANKTRHVDVRIIAATNRDLSEEIRKGRFREDLYYRLNVIPIQILPLRSRKEDIEDLANYFIRQYAPQGENFILSPEALKKLQAHQWPGNIRELENVIQRALCFANPGFLKPEDLQIDEGLYQEKAPSGIAYCNSYDEFKKYLQEQERQFLTDSIAKNGGSVSLTAERLGMLRTALYNRLSRLGVKVRG